MGNTALDYAQNIVDTVREPLVVLDDKFRVISTNRSFSSTFKVTPEMSENTMLFDLGNRQWDIPKLRELLEEVLPKSTSIEDFEVEHDFPAIGRKTMLLNARRIRSKTGATQILLAIEDITERKRLEDELRDASEYAQDIVNTVREPLVVLDDKFRVISTNRSFSSTFKVTPEMSENTMLFDLGNGQWNIPKLRELLEKVLPKSTSIEDFEVEHDFPAIGRKTMLLNARRIRSKTGATQILLAIEDITERKRAEEELQRINIELEEVLERETNVSQSLQAVFYPRIKQIEGYQFAARYRSVLQESELGGDNYDVFSLGGDETALAIVDVSGKGLQAAILGAFVKSIIRAYLRERSGVSE